MKKLLLLLLIPALAGADVLLKWSDNTAEAGEWGGGGWMACRYDVSGYGYITKARIYSYGPGASFYLGIFWTRQTYYYALLRASRVGWGEYPIYKSIPSRAFVAIKCTTISSRYQLGIDRTPPHHKQYMYAANFAGALAPETWRAWPRDEDFMIQIWVNTTAVNPTSLGRVRAIYAQ